MHRLSVANKNYNLLFAALEAAYWASNGALYAFTVTILTAHGYGSAFCGFVTTGIAVVSVGAQFALGYITDTFIPAKRVLMVLLMVGGGLSLLLPMALKHSPAVTLISIVGVSLLDYSLYTTIDVWAVCSAKKHHNIDFSTVRSGGSMGYALVALVMGAVVAQQGVDILFYIHAGLAVVATLICFTLEEVPCANKRAKNASQSAGEKGLSLWEVVKILSRNRPYVTFIASMILMQFSFRITATYLPLLVTNAGGDSGHLGIALFVGSALEVMAMAIASRLLVRGIPPSYVLVGAFFCGMVRMFTLHFDQSIWILIPLQLFQALAMGGYLRVYTEYIHRITPSNISATATTIGTAMGMGVGGMIGNLLGGVIIERLGIHFYMTLSGVGFVLAALVFLPTFLEVRRQRQQEILQRVG